MLREWLGALSVEELRARYLQQRPLACAGTARATCSFDWSAFGRLLPQLRDALVVRRGEVVDRPLPTNLGKLVEGFRLGNGLAVRGGEHLSAQLAAIHADFERELGPSHVQLFATAGGTHGFGWHFDDEDVFIAQTCGIKDYFFCENTVTTGPARPEIFARFSDETAAMHTATLAPGDVLYIPARWWHVAEPREHSLSISVGVRPRFAPTRRSDGRAASAADPR